MSAPTEQARDRKPLHPFCNVCGWRKGGLDSWDGRRCKCGLSEPAFPEPSEVTPIQPTGMTVEQKTQLDREIQTASDCNGRRP